MPCDVKDLSGTQLTTFMRATEATTTMLGAETIYDDGA
jgi:hypothetical protein